MKALLKITTFLLVSLLVLLPTLAEAAKMRRQTKEYKEYFENGKLKKYTRVKTAQTIGFEIDNNYKRTAIYQVEYFENGKTHTSFEKITKIGNAGKRCYEIKTITKTYDENGILRKKEINKCDQGKTIVKFYDEKGKLTFTKIVYDVS